MCIWQMPCMQNYETAGNLHQRWTRVHFFVMHWPGSSLLQLQLFFPLAVQNAKANTRQLVQFVTLKEELKLLVMSKAWRATFQLSITVCHCKKRLQARHVLQQCQGNILCRKKLDYVLPRIPARYISHVPVPGATTSMHLSLELHLLLFRHYKFWANNTMIAQICTMQGIARSCSLF